MAGYAGGVKRGSPGRASSGGRRARTIDPAGLLVGARFVASPNCDDRPPGTEVTLLVAKEVAQRLQGLVGYVVELKVQYAESDLAFVLRLLAEAGISFLFEGDGPCFAVAKIGLSEDPWSLPVKDGAAIAEPVKN